MTYNPAPPGSPNWHARRLYGTDVAPGDLAKQTEQQAREALVQTETMRAQPQAIEAVRAVSDADCARVHASGDPSELESHARRWARKAEQVARTAGHGKKARKRIARAAYVEHGGRSWKQYRSDRKAGKPVKIKKSGRLSKARAERIRREANAWLFAELRKRAANSQPGGYKKPRETGNPDPEANAEGYGDTAPDKTVPMDEATSQSRSLRKSSASARAQHRAWLAHRAAGGRSTFDEFSRR